jgi:hypothetical protein
MTRFNQLVIIALSLIGLLLPVRVLPAQSIDC